MLGRTLGLTIAGAIGLIGVAGAFGAAAAEPEISLRPKWVVGSTDLYRVVQDSSKKQTQIPGGPKGVDRTIRQEITLSRRVVSQEGSSTTLELRVVDIKMDILSDGEHATFDSTLPPETEQHAQLAPLMRKAIDLPLTVTLNRDDEVTGIQGNLPADGNPRSLPQTIVGDPFLREVLRPLYRLPSSPASASVGKAWDRVDAEATPPIGTVHTTVTYRLESIKGQEATISLKGGIVISPALGPTAVKSETKVQSIEGSGIWDAEAGSLKSLKRTERLDLDLENPAGTVPFSSQTITIFERLPKPPTAAEHR